MSSRPIIPDYDLCIIGGGVNGAGIARDATGRGLSVLLLEIGDLAGATSSASSKMIHGGLRYLEYFEFKLVREALIERDVLLGIAPHIMYPMDFVLPHANTIRPAWMIRLGLFLYDHLARIRHFKRSTAIKVVDDARCAPLKNDYKTAFTYADGWVDDARLVALNAVDAAEMGAHILTHAACTGLHVENGIWHVEMYDTDTGQSATHTARMVVNAAGPWVRDILDGSQLTIPGKTPNVRLVKGSHIVVPKLYDGSQAFNLQQPDRRVIFVIPYQDKYTLIGTTDIDHPDDTQAPEISPEETQYLCDCVNRYFKSSIAPADVVWSYSGVRPLFDDGRGKASKVTRDYRLILDTDHGAPILSVFGGKITTYRHLAQEAVNKLIRFWPNYAAARGMDTIKPWTHTMHLPGGDIGDDGMDAFIAERTRRYKFLPATVVRRYATTYGTRMDRILAEATDLDSLGRHFGDGVYMAEINYLIQNEWVKCADDMLWRRTKLGLHISDETRTAIEQYFEGHPVSSQTARGANVTRQIH